MMETLLNMMHVGPLVVIAIAVLVNIITSGNVFKPELYNATLLVLSSIGIAAGAYAHDHNSVFLIDPCLAYSAALIFVAARLIVGSLVKADK